MSDFTCNLAIVIGINNYHNGIADLKTAKPDAAKLAGLLSKDYNYQVELITDETERKPTLTEIRTLLTEWLPQQLKPPAENNRLLFYFAGHGMPLESDDGPRGFLLPQDANPNPKPGESNNFLPMQELHDALITLPCHHLLIILDCCFAGTFRWSSTRKAIPIPETIHRQHYDRFIRYPAWQVIASSAHNQEALDFLSDKRGISAKDEQHSPFAEALFEALQDGEPDEKGNRHKEADLTKDGVITAPELYLYLRDNVETRSGERQTPGLFPLKKHDRGEYIFHDPSFDPTTLSEAPELDEANNPYRGLKPFEEEHARFFFGRQALIEELAKRLSKPDQALTVVLGVSGSGKSSLVKAGLIPHLRNQHLVQICLLELLIQFSPSPLQLRLITQIHQWKILTPMRPGESPFASLARTLFAIADTPFAPQLNQLDFLNGLLQDKLEQLNTEIAQAVIQGKENSSKVKQLQREAEMLTQLITDWNDASPFVRQRLLVEHFEMLYSLCQTEEQDSEQQQQLKQAFQDCLAPLIQQLQSDPGSFVAIAQEWAQNHPDQRLLLIIDQFEELITLARTTLQNSQNEQPEEWQQFLSLLETSLAADLPQLRIIVTLRSDFEPRFLSSEALKPYWSKARFPVRPMRSDELRQAIEGPASEMALYFEPANLVDRLIDEIGQMPGVLPLLSFTLSELYVKLADKWRNQETSDRALSIDDQFDQEGGIAGSLTRRANEEYDKLVKNADTNDKYQGGFGKEEGKAYQVTMRRIMLRMLTLEGGETARRRVPDSELVYPTQEESDRVRQVVERLVNARLLVRGQLETGEPYVEPAHDFLVRGWGRLQEWINEEKAKEILELQQRLTPQANDWDRNNRPDGLLLPDGDRLKHLKTILQSGRYSFNSRETEFINISLRKAKVRQMREELPRKAARVLDLLSAQPTDGLVLAIQTMGQNLANIPNEVFGSVQSSLLSSVQIARERRVLQAHTSNVASVAVSQSARTIVSGSFDTTLRLWDMQGNVIGKPLQGHEAWVNSVAISQDGEWIVSGSRDDTIRLWAANGTYIRQILQAENAGLFGITAVAINTDGTIIVSGKDNGEIQLFNKQGQPITEPFQHGEGVRAIAFSPDGKTIASGSQDCTIRLWDLKGNSIGLPLVEHSEWVNSVVFSPEGSYIASASHDGTVCLWNQQGELVGSPLRGHGDIVTSVAFSPGGETIASGSHDNTIRLWNLQGNPVGLSLKGSKPIEGPNFFVESLAFSSDGQTIISGHADGTVRLWDYPNDLVGKCFRGHQERICSVAISSEMKASSHGFEPYIISGGYDQTIRMWDLRGNLVGQPFQHEGSVLSVAISPDGQHIASGSGDKMVRLWDCRGNLIGQPFCGHEYPVWAVTFSPNGQTIASGSRDGTVRLWDLQGNSIGQPFIGHEDSVWSIVFSSDGEMIVSGGLDGTVRLWNRQGKPLTKKPFEGHREAVTAVAIRFDGRVVVSGGRDNNIRLWDIQGNPIGQPFQQENWITSVAISPDGQYIVSGSEDKAIRLWDFQGNLIGQPLRGHEKRVTSVAISHDGQYIISGSDDETVRLWQAGSWKSWLQTACYRLRYHPVFTNPESIEGSEQREVAIAACETCKKYVWNVEDETG
ncbi:caspase family protein [Leptolyngbya sp. ST-U4]|uniref:nSTAND1 domain-containing NTPase n=1 Tax=Leptolyngbya sp. ST-U4 TaxID=2933912 RepID=UPI00329A468D